MKRTQMKRTHIKRATELNLDRFNNSVNNFVKWACGINNHPLRDIFFGGMKTKYEFFFLIIPTPIISSTTL